jgi:DNA-binding NarL/FixJ family response regulator
MTNVFIADDSSAMRAAIQIRLEKEPDIRVVGEAANYDQAVKFLTYKKPDVLVTEIRMPSSAKAQPEHIAELARACNCSVIVISFSEPDVEIEATAKRLGAFRILDKTTLYDTLVPTIREAVAAKQPAAI